jgi:hypothetical protein
MSPRSTQHQDLEIPHLVSERSNKTKREIRIPHLEPRHLRTTLAGPEILLLDFGLCKIQYPIAQIQLSGGFHLQPCKEEIQILRLAMNQWPQ